MKSNGIGERLFGFVYDMAFNDATMRRAFSKMDGEDKSEYRKRKEIAKDYSREYVRKYIDSIFCNETPDPIFVIAEISKKCKDIGFTFGNAQKLVNMSAKYMYISTYDNLDLREFFSACHCPMDGTMIDVVSKNNAFSVNTDFSWSKMMLANDTIPKEYEEFQNLVKAMSNACGCYPVEFDYFNWE